jgi:hypothetical protein
MVYGYTNGIFAAWIIEPGKGYWLKASGEGYIVLVPATSKTVAENWNSYNSITITDKLERSQTLYAAEDAENRIDMNRYEMPPLPPQGEFDARYKSSRILETYHPSDKVGEFPIVLQSAVYPLEVSFDVKSGGKGLELLELENGKILASHPLNKQGRMVIKKGNANSLMLRITDSKMLPKEFALSQNYPNPFNPSTTINYDLPITGYVTLTVYDILGRRIKTLLNEVRPAGFHSAEWDARNDHNLPVPSGTYFVRMTSSKQSFVRKMLLLR